MVLYVVWRRMRGPWGMGCVNSPARILVSRCSIARIGVHQLWAGGQDGDSSLGLREGRLR
jgi:hypothetical protein